MNSMKWSAFPAAEALDLLEDLQEISKTQNVENDENSREINKLHASLRRKIYRSSSESLLYSNLLMGRKNKLMKKPIEYCVPLDFFRNNYVSVLASLPAVLYQEVLKNVMRKDDRHENSVPFFRFLGTSLTYNVPRIFSFPSSASSHVQFSQILSTAFPLVFSKVWKARNLQQAGGMPDLIQDQKDIQRDRFSINSYVIDGVCGVGALVSLIAEILSKMLRPNSIEMIYDEKEKENKIVQGSSEIFMKSGNISNEKENINCEVNNEELNLCFTVAHDGGELLVCDVDLKLVAFLLLHFMCRTWNGGESFDYVTKSVCNPNLGIFLMPSSGEASPCALTLIKDSWKRIHALIYARTRYKILNNDGCPYDLSLGKSGELVFKEVGRMHNQSHKANETNISREKYEGKGKVPYSKDLSDKTNMSSATNIDAHWFGYVEVNNLLADSSLLDTLKQSVFAQIKEKEISSTFEFVNVKEKYLHSNHSLSETTKMKKNCAMKSFKKFSPSYRSILHQCVVLKTV